MGERDAPGEEEKRRAEIAKLTAETEAISERRPFELAKVKADARGASRAFWRQLAVAFVGLIVPVAGLMFTAHQWIESNRKQADEDRQRRGQRTCRRERFGRRSCSSWPSIRSRTSTLRPVQPRQS